jgi:hypothetical protein
VDDDALIVEAERIASRHERALDEQDIQREYDALLHRVAPPPPSSVQEFLMQRLCTCWQHATVREYLLPAPGVQLWMFILLNQHQHEDGSAMIEVALVTRTEADGFSLLDFKKRENNE